MLGSYSSYAPAKWRLAYCNRRTTTLLIVVVVADGTTCLDGWWRQAEGKTAEHAFEAIDSESKKIVPASLSISTRRLPQRRGGECRKDVGEERRG